MLFLLIFLKLSLFLSNVAALSITVQQHSAVAGQPSLVSWAREASDGSDALNFDLRFVRPEFEDDGLASANIQATPSTQSGVVKVVFPSSGSFQLVAVTGPDFTQIGESAQVNVFAFPTLPSVSPASTSVSPTSTSKPVPCATMTTTCTVLPTSTASGASHKKNIGAIVGGTLGGVAFLGLLAALAIMFVRRHQQQQPEKRRWTFYRDMMVRPVDTNANSVSPSNAGRSVPTDVEQGLAHDTSPDVSVSVPQFMIASPDGTRPFIRSYRERPLPSVPLTSRQKTILERMEQVRNKMMELEKNPGPTQHIMLDDIQKQMSWLQDQLGAPWAMGLTDVTPQGFGHNMLP